MKSLPCRETCAEQHGQQEDERGRLGNGAEYELAGQDPLVPIRAITTIAGRVPSKSAFSGAPRRAIKPATTTGMIRKTSLTEIPFDVQGVI